MQLEDWFFCSVKWILLFQDLKDLLFEEERPQDQKARARALNKFAAVLSQTDENTRSSNSGRLLSCVRR